MEASAKTSPTASTETSMELICIRCPLGCPLQVDVEGDSIVAVMGNQCIRGARYAEEEAVSPTRVVTGFVCVPGAMEPLSLKTAAPVPKDKVVEVANAMRELSVSLPVRVGDVLCNSVCGLDVAILATKDLG